MNSLIFDKKDNLWLGTTENGLLKISGNNEKEEVSHYPVSNKKIFAMLSLEGDEILCGTENDGLLLLNNEGTI